MMTTRDCFHRTAVLGALLATLVWCVCAGRLAAQDQPPQQPPPSESAPPTEESTGDAIPPSVEPADDAAATGQSLEELKKEWAELDAQIGATEAEMNHTADVDARLNARSKFHELVAQADELIAKIKAAALAELEAGNTDPEVVKTLVGIMINDANFDREADVFEMAKVLGDHGVEAKYFEAAAQAQRLAPLARELMEEVVIRHAESLADDLPRVRLTTSKGDIVLELFENEAPQTVGNFISLVKSGFYDGLTFHRVLGGFVAQGGDPKGDGSGGPGYSIYCECYEPNARLHFTGSLSMAHAGPNTGGSQFFITLSRSASVSLLDRKHTVFGRVIEGMDVVNSLTRRDPQQPSQPDPDKIVKAEVLRDRGHEYVPTKVTETGNTGAPK